MTFSKILESKEGSGEIMAKYGLHCIGCMMARMESLEEGCLAHGLSEENILSLLDEINKLE